MAKMMTMGHKNNIIDHQKCIFEIKNVVFGYWKQIFVKTYIFMINADQGCNNLSNFLHAQLN